MASMVGGLICIERRSLSTSPILRAARSGGAGRLAAGPSTVPALVLARRGGGQSQRRPGGAGSGGMHRLAVRGRGNHRGRLSGESPGPSQPTLWRRGVASDTPKPTAATRPSRASCSKTEICPRAGSRPRSCWSGGEDASLQGAGRPAHPVGGAHPRRAATITAGRRPKVRSATRRPRPLSPIPAWP